MGLKDRTSELRKKGYAGRRLGPVQMTTDTAVRVTRMVVHDRGEKSILMLFGLGTLQGDKRLIDSSAIGGNPIR
jgi:hypothetical protein